jgi:hypothetical protein
MKPGYRRCISCGKVALKPAFWRVVCIHPDRSVQLDQGMGRSAYLCPQEDCIKLAQRKHRLERALKTIVPKELYSQLLERLLSRSASTADQEQ